MSPASAQEYVFLVMREDDTLSTDTLIDQPPLIAALKCLNELIFNIYTAERFPSNV